MLNSLLTKIQIPFSLKSNKVRLLGPARNEKLSDSVNQQQTNQETMKLNKALICVTAVAAMMLGGYSAPAQPHDILCTFELSGKAMINDTSSTLDGDKTVLEYTKGKFKTEDLINSLNDSTPFISFLNNYTEGGLSSLPAETVFCFDPYNYSYVYLLLPTGGIIPLTDVYVPYYSGYYNFAYFSWQFFSISGKYSVNNNTGEGKETDQLTQLSLYFDNQDEDGDYLYMSIQGQMDLKWKAGEVSEGYRELDLKAKFNGTGYVDMDGYYGTVTAKGKGKTVEETGVEVWYQYWPYYSWVVPWEE
jgi:hypothetical protein